MATRVLRCSFAFRFSSSSSSYVSARKSRSSVDMDVVQSPYDVDAKIRVTQASVTQASRKQGWSHRPDSEHLCLERGRIARAREPSQSKKVMRGIKEIYSGRRIETRHDFLRVLRGLCGDSRLRLSRRAKLAGRCHALHLREAADLALGLDSRGRLSPHGLRRSLFIATLARSRRPSTR